MSRRIALAGNPNSGKTTLFNALTGSRQYVGNWPGVTVEKKSGIVKGQADLELIDLPGIYSMSPYSLEEVVARDFLIDEKPDVILNIIDATNLERNLFLTTQLLELEIPMIIALNMMDVVTKNDDKINIENLSSALGVDIIPISALRGKGIDEIVARSLSITGATDRSKPPVYSSDVEEALHRIESIAASHLTTERRWHAIKLFERDAKIMERLDLSDAETARLEEVISKLEDVMDDDAESIITMERYEYISHIIQGNYQKQSSGSLTTSDKIDRIVTNRWLGLPIFALIMFLVYYLSISTVGTAATDWANDQLFGDGWHLLGRGSAEYEAAVDDYGDSEQIIHAFNEAYGDAEIAQAIDVEDEAFDEAAADEALAMLVTATPEDASVTYYVEDEETLAVEPIPGMTKTDLEEAVADFTGTDYKSNYGAPEPSTYGTWVPGIPVAIGNALQAMDVSPVLEGLILDGIVAGLGAVLGFVPQMLVLFLLLAFLEACGYMARIAFVLDRIFRRFGLSGKSFIPMLIGTGCSVPAIMASRTIENDNDRRMTILTTSFIPCSAKIPFISMIAGAIFGGSAWVATSAYFVGMVAVVISGIMLKKTRPFAGETMPFVMELPTYHMPTVSNLLRSTWERGWSFIKKAGSIILLSTIVIWFLSFFGVVNGRLQMLTDDQLNQSILATLGTGFAWIFAPLGWGTWQAAVSSVTGLVAKENIVGTLGILYGSEGNVYAAMAEVFTPIAGYSFLVFNLLCTPCFAALGAIHREMNHWRWTAFAIAWQTVLAYSVSLMINQFGLALSGRMNLIGFVAALFVLMVMLWMLLRPTPRGQFEVQEA